MQQMSVRPHGMFSIASRNNKQTCKLCLGMRWSVQYSEKANKYLLVESASYLHLWHFNSLQRNFYNQMWKPVIGMLIWKPLDTMQFMGTFLSSVLSILNISNFASMSDSKLIVKPRLSQNIIGCRCRLLLRAGPDFYRLWSVCVKHYCQRGGEVGRSCQSNWPRLTQGPVASHWLGRLGLGIRKVRN